MLQSGKMRVSGLDLGHTIADVKTTFSSEKPPISALYYSVSGLTTPHSIHTPPQAVSVGVSVAWRWCRPALELLAIAPLSAGRTLVKCGCGDGSVSHSQASILEVFDGVFIIM